MTSGRIVVAGAVDRLCDVDRACINLECWGG